MSNSIYVNSNYNSMSNMELERIENSELFSIESQIQKGKATNKKSDSQKEETKHENY